MAGQPRKFKSEEHITELFGKYCQHIRENEYKQLCTFSLWIKWLGEQGFDVSMKTINNTLRQYLPEVKKEIESMRADVLAEGAALGKYNTTMVIFALKNWCKWTDKIETDNKTTVSIEEFLKNAGEQTL